MITKGDAITAIAGWVMAVCIWYVIFRIAGEGL